MQLSCTGTGLKIPTWQKSGPCIYNHSQIDIFTSPLSYNLWPAKCCSSVRTALQHSLFEHCNDVHASSTVNSPSPSWHNWSELHYSVLCLSSEMMYMPHQLSTAHLHHDTIGPNCTAEFFRWATRRCTCFIPCQQLISIMRELLNMWEDGANASVYFGDMMQKVNTSVN
jgi:hypothetical protein